MSGQIPLENIVILVLQELLEGEIEEPDDRVKANYILIRLQDGNKLTGEEAGELADIFNMNKEFWVGMQEDQTISEDGGA